MKFAASIAMFMFLTISGTAQASASNRLCIHQPVKPGSSVQTEPLVINRVYDETDIEELYSVVRSFEGSWITPNAIWPSDSSIVSVLYYGAVECQIIFSGTSIYVLAADKLGFVERPLTFDEVEMFLRW